MNESAFRLIACKHARKKIFMRLTSPTHPKKKKKNSTMGPITINKEIKMASFPIRIKFGQNQ